MDDLLTSHDDKSMLLEALTDIEETLMNHGFMIKRIISNGLWFHAHNNLLKNKDTSLDGTFTADAYYPGLTGLATAASLN